MLLQHRALEPASKAHSCRQDALTESGSLCTSTPVQIMDSNTASQSLIAGMPSAGTANLRPQHTHTHAPASNYNKENDSTH